MMKHGKDNVRGGSYSKLILDKEEEQFLQKEFRGAEGTCFNCNGNHFIRNCPLKKKQNYK